MLEIGCGSGLLAARLQADGFEVLAIDADEHCAAAARSLGVDARAAEWPCPLDGGFDAVLFTRSLHHVHDLEGGIAAAFANLAEEGRLIVEDFDSAFADEAALRWFAGLVRSLRAAGAEVDASDFLKALGSNQESALDVWHAQHDRHLHPAARIEAALRQASEFCTVESAAYFFRYIAAALPGAVELIEAVRTHEAELISTGTMAPLGRRYVAER